MGRTNTGDAASASGGASGGGAKKRVRKKPSAAVLSSNSSISSGGLLPTRSKGVLATLIVDTGGCTVKHSVAAVREGDSSSSFIRPRVSPNATAKPKHQLTVLCADEICSISNKGQLEFSRPMERGYVTDLACQRRVWTRILDEEGISSLSPSPGQQLTSKKNKRTTPYTHTASTMAVLSLCPPFVTSCAMEREADVFFRDFGFARLARRLTACMSAYRYLRHHNDDDDDGTDCCLVIDSGFSFTHIVPTYRYHAVESAIRRINIGGKLLTNLLKETISYRQWNVMDDFPIVNEAKEALCFVNPTTSFRNDTTDLTRDFLLPDFVETFHGTVLSPAYLQKDPILSNRTHNDEEVHPNNHNSMETTAHKRHDDDEDDGDNDVDSEEESDDQIRRRVQKQREEERRLREQFEQERQVLSLSVERFAVPEVLFRPSDIGLQQLGIAQAIVQSIEACDPIHRAAMYHNIVLTGGNVRLPHFQQRLETELRSLAPTNYHLRIYLPDDPILYAWHGALEYSKTKECVTNAYVDQITWESNKDSSVWGGVDEEELEGLGLVLV